MNETKKTITTETPDLKAYRAAADGLRHCLTLGDMAAARGNANRAAEYLLGALADLGPEFRRLRKARNVRGRDVRS